MATSVNFFQPGTDASVDVNQLQRQRLLADALVKQGQTTPQGQMVSGHYVAPNALSYVSQLASALGGAYKERQSDADERGLVQKLAAQRGKEASDFMAAASGTPASTQEVPTNAPSATNPNGNLVEAAPVTTPAVAPDRSKALALALQSQNPMLQGVGGKMMEQQMADQQLADIMRTYGGGGGAPGGSPGAPGSPTGAPGVPGAAGAPAGGPPLMGGGGIPSGVSPLAFSLTASGNPTFGKLGTMVQDASKPVPLTEGGTLLRPDGSVIYTAPKTEPGIGVVGIPGQPGQYQANPVQGYGAAKAAISGQVAGSEAAAKDPYAGLVKVDTPNGPKMVTPAQARVMAGAPAPTDGPPQQPGGPVGPNNYNANALRTQTGGGAPNDAVALPQIAAAAQREIAATKASLAQTNLDPASRAQLQAHLADIQQQAANVTQQLGTAPAAGGAGINLQTDEQAKFGTQVASGAADALLAGQKTAQAASDSLSTISRARDAIKGGVFQGSGAETKLAIAKFVNANIPGVNIDPAKVGNTDYLSSTLGAGLLSEAKTLGTNPSNADATRINDIVGSIGKDPGAMAKILDWRQEMAQRAIDQHNSRVSDAEGRGLKAPYDLRVNPPQGAAPAGGDFKLISVQH